MKFSAGFTPPALNSETLSALSATTHLMPLFVTHVKTRLPQLV